VHGAAGAAPVFGRPSTGVGDDDNGPGTVLHGLYWLTVALAERNAPLLLLLDDARARSSASPLGSISGGALSA